MSINKDVSLDTDLISRGAGGMMFNIQPVKPIFPKNEKEKRDLELWNAITTAIHSCGLNGEDVTAMGLETLRRLGRYDLLPPCERRTDG